MRRDPRLIPVARSLQADLVAGEVADALREVDVRLILLRGPALTGRLYDPGVARPYGDVDLLVSTHELAEVERVLAALGFEDRTVLGVIAGDRPAYAHTWVRDADGAVVDLHLTLPGVGAPPVGVWACLDPLTELLQVRASELRVLRDPGCAVVVALHAAAHGVAVEKPLTDLEHALDRFDSPTWLAAAELAGQLDAIEAFAAGLRLLPAGRALAERLELPAAASVETALRASTPPPTALGFEWLARTTGLRAKTRLLGRKLFPQVEFMRAWSPLARRSKVGLGAAYAMRPFWLARHALPGLAAWRRARRRAS